MAALAAAVTVEASAAVAWVTAAAVTPAAEAEEDKSSFAAALPQQTRGMLALIAAASRLGRREGASIDRALVYSEAGRARFGMIEFYLRLRAQTLRGFFGEFCDSKVSLS